jgi:hypothetical protein
MIEGAFDHEIVSDRGELGGTDALCLYLDVSHGGFARVFGSENS